MWRFVSLLCVLVAAINGQTGTAGISRCTSNSGELPLYAYIEGCAQTPCPVARGSDATIHMVFRAPRTMRTMRTYATAHILFSINYDLQENAETCNFLTNSYCPVLENEVLQYTLRMGIETSFPMITVNIEFRVEDDNNQSFVCIRLPVSVVAANSNNILANNATVPADF